MESEVLPSSERWQIGVDWLPDETFYSLCCRMHRLMGYSWAHQTSKKLFCTTRGGISHDFPSPLAEFVKSAGGALGGVVEIAQQRTLLPYYLAFKDEVTAERAMFAMVDGKWAGAAKSTLGIAASGLRAHHPLKACSACMEEDQAEGLPPYWRRSHQLPGVDICPTHHWALKATSAKTNGIRRFDWLLPDECVLTPPAGHGEATSDTEGWTQRLALSAAAVALGQTPLGSRFEPDRLARTYRQGLDRAGFLKRGGSLRRTEAVQSLLQFNQQLPIGHFDQRILTRPEEALSLLTRCRDSDRVFTHPLRHLLLALWLFGDWRGFLGVYRESAEQEEENLPRGSEPVLAGKRESLQGKKRDFQLLISEQHLSVSAAAQRLGIATGTAMAWAAQSGLIVKRRPKSITEPVRLGLVADLRKGLDKAQTAARHGVSIQAINLLLRTEVDLHSAWKSAQQSSLLTQHRHHWSITAKSYKGLTPVVARGLMPSTYAWLYRNDRQWLRGQLQQLSRTQRSHHSGVDWDRRDAEFAKAIEDSVTRMMESTGRRHCDLRELFALVPLLAPKMRNLHRLPLTARALERATRAQSAKTERLL